MYTHAYLILSYFDFYLHMCLCKFYVHIFTGNIYIIFNKQTAINAIDCSKSCCVNLILNVHVPVVTGSYHVNVSCFFLDRSVNLPFPNNALPYTSPPPPKVVPVQKSSSYGVQNSWTGVQHRLCW